MVSVTNSNYYYNKAISYNKQLDDLKEKINTLKSDYDSFLMCATESLDQSCSLYKGIIEMVVAMKSKIDKCYGEICSIQYEAKVKAIKKDNEIYRAKMLAQINSKNKNLSEVNGDV